MTTVDRIPWARRARHAVPSAVREILKVTERPDIISFAGGLPAEELFPVGAMSVAVERTLARAGGAALQYGTTEGFLGLRSWVAERMARRGRAVTAEDVMITAGSQQGLDLVARVLLDAGDTVLVEAPTYVAAIQVLRSAEARLVSVPSDSQGIDVEALAQAIVKERPKLLYLNPDHQNPSGCRLAPERRQAVIALCRDHGVAILEDDPYGEICFEGNRHAPLHAQDDSGTVIYVSTFSKTLAPGLRLGWVSAPPALLRALAIAKQGADLHTGTLAQRSAATLLEDFDYDGHVRTIRAAYHARARAMEAALRAHFPAGATWVSPTGGMFLWVSLPAGVSVEGVFARALAAKVAFVSGDPFFAGAAPGPFMRLNFSHRPESVIADGVQRLAGALRAELEGGAATRSTPQGRGGMAEAGA
jgi:2-aminoadipate transaminase